MSLLRWAAADRLAERELRQTARELDLTHALHKFLGGPPPPTAAERSLERWTAARHGDPAEAGEATIDLLGFLLGKLPPARRAGAVERVAAEVEEAFAAAGLPRPAWLAAARDTLRREASDPPPSGAPRRGGRGSTP